MAQPLSVSSYPKAPINSNWIYCTWNLAQQITFKMDVFF